MAHMCFNCSKRSVRGTQHRHHPGVAGRQHLRKAPRTLKIFVPNLHWANVMIMGAYKRVLLCTKCRRFLKKQGRIKTWTKPEEKVMVKKVEKAVKPQTVEKKPPETKKPEKPVKITRKTKSEPVPTVSVEELVGKR